MMKAAHPVGAEHRRVLVLYLDGDVSKSENDKCLAHASQTLNKKVLGRKGVLFGAVWIVLEFTATIVEEQMLKDDELLLLWMDFFWTILLLVVKMEIRIVIAGKGFLSEVSVVPIAVILERVLQRCIITHGPVVVGGGLSQMRCKMPVLRADSS